MTGGSALLRAPASEEPVAPVAKGCGNRRFSAAPGLRRRGRAIILQALVLAAVGALIGFLVYNATLNLRARGLASGFDFLSKEAGFAIGFSLIPFAETDTYGRVFLVGLLNTALVAVVSMVLATAAGIVIGVARVSAHPPTAAAAVVYVETWRNIPLLLQVLFWHQLLINALPGVRQSLSAFNWVFLNNRGLVVPSVGLDALPVPPSFVALSLFATSCALLAVVLGGREPSRQRTLAARTLGAAAVAQVLIIFFAGEWERPTLRGFNFQGGVTLVPEFVALVVALVIYNAAFIAEIVRAGIESVGRGQREAAKALGLRPALVMRLVVLPQALRVIIPPLANQYSHMLKASSLATVIGYPDIVNVFLGTTLNQTGRAIEIVSITMAVFLMMSAAVAAFTAWFDRRIALVER
jgi:general L-amino acid transport system permease protein